MAGHFLSVDRFPLEIFALLDPPSWTRLEPQTTTGDPRPGLEARVHDPLWLLTRQWQLGEFEGEDAGTPLTVLATTTTVPIDRWAPGDRAPDGGADAVAALDRDTHDLLEPWVEREPVPASAAGPGLRPRAEAASALLAALDDAPDIGDQRAAFVRECPLDLTATADPDGAHAALDPAWVRLTRLLAGGAMADGQLICEAIEAATPGLPPWLVPASAAERAGLLRELTTWAAWYRAEVSPEPGGHNSWTAQRLEYRFRVGAGDSSYVAPAHGGGDIDWHTFDAAPAGSLPSPDGVAAAAPPADVLHVLLAGALRYPGMPADRLWEMEDARVNLGIIEAEPWDLARLMVAEFALTYGNDWLVIPLDVPFGSVTTVRSVKYTTTFGERYRVAVEPDDRWRMFAITAPRELDVTVPAGREPAPSPAVPGLLIPPSAVAVQDGPPVEEVLFLRDEMANMAWAVERTVQAASGAGRNRAREADDPGPITAGPVPTAELDYRLQTGVAARWIPYLPRSDGYRSIHLVRAAMPDAAGVPVRPLGRLLAEPEQAILVDAEVPREGVRVRRVPSMTRRADGTYVRWTTRRVSVGRGEGASRLEFDVAPARRPVAE